jgi:diguanylate cyclase (GGDEF)-like protein
MAVWATLNASDHSDLWRHVLRAVLIVVWAVSGAALVRRRPDEYLGRLVAGGAVIAAMGVVAAALLGDGEESTLLYGVRAMSLALLPAAATHLIIALPSGELTSRNRRSTVIGAYGVAVVTGLYLWSHRAEIPRWPVVLEVLAGAVIALALSNARYRRVRGVERQRMQWFGWALAVALEATLITGAMRLLLGWPTLEVAIVATAPIPIALVVAASPRFVSRIDRLLAHTVSVAGLTGVVVAVYLVIVLGLGRVPNDDERRLLLLSMLAAVVAALLFDPVFQIAGGHGLTGDLARLAYPVGDLAAVGLVGAAWSIAGRRIQPHWILLGLGFAVLAAADSVYVVQAAMGDWALGGPLDLPYALGTMLLAAAAWASPRESERRADADVARLVLPVVSGFVALGLVAIAVVAELNPLATALGLLTLFAVVLRLGSTLVRLSRQRVDLARLAATDPLTGLANHRALHERLDAEIASAASAGTPVSVVVLDLDHFKIFNDTYGHTEGDGALQAVASELLRQARAGDLVGRAGGEEFMLVLPGSSADDAYAVAERCRTALTVLPIQGGGIGCSAGVATYPTDDPAGARLAELADGALYWAKRSGRSHTRRYDPREVVLLSGAEQRAQVQEVLDTDGALTPWFQPIVELATGRIAGYEALTRFMQTAPVRAPDIWFAQARRCGLGPALEARAIEVALAVPGRPEGTFLSLNVSPAAVVSNEVRRVLPRDLSGLVIELTEDEVFSTDDALDAELARLRARGARIAVDDAGAGYAGLQQLVRVKPDIVKLDRSLITGVDEDASKIALLEALARFASTTGAAVCGEGIETADELRALARLDTTYAQGYALGQPGPAWPGIAAPMAAHTSAEVSMGMRLARGASSLRNVPLTLGQVGETLARARTRGDLRTAVDLMARLLHADDVAVSRVLPRERCVETLSEHDWGLTGERFSYDDYPTTEHVISAQVLGQLIEGDPAADKAELGLLTASGFKALLIAPVVFRGETVGLVEIYRRAALPWSGLEVDHARILAHSLGWAIQNELGVLPWSPQTVLGGGV